MYENNEPYTAAHAGLFFAAFALASLVAILALALQLAGKRPSRRTSARVALAIVALALAFSCFAVLRTRASIDALLTGQPLASACSAERVRHLGYGDARASALLALWAAPLTLALATYVLARSLRPAAWLGWAATPWALFGAILYLYLQPLPGRYLWPGRCQLEDDVAAILGGGEQAHRGCTELAALLKDPRAMGQALGRETQATALPTLPELKKRCLVDMLAQVRQDSPYVSRRDSLGSPFVAPEDVEEVTKTLDAIGAP